MSITDKIILVLLAICCVVILVFIPKPSVHRCGSAEFESDIPQHIQEQCREQHRMKL